MSDCEEVDAFTRSQQVLSRKDSANPVSGYQSMKPRWESAREEKSGDSGSSSLTQVPVESVCSWWMKWKRTVMAGIAAGSLVLLSACSSIPQDDNQPVGSPSPSHTLSEASTQPEPAPSSKLSSVQQKQAEGLTKAGLEVSGKKQSNKDGSYTQVVVRKGSDLATFDPSKHATEDLPKGWTKNDASEAQEFAANFLIQNVIDSPSRGDGAKVIETAKKTSDIFSKKYRTELTDLAKAEDSFLLYRTWSEHDPKWSTTEYKLKHDGGSRILDSNIEVAESQNWGTGTHIIYSGSYNLLGTMNNEDYSEKHHIHYGLTVVKENSGFKISGVSPSIYPGGVKTSDSPVSEPVKIAK